MVTGRVVIVEDSPTAGEFLRRLVEESGFEVVGIADNGISGEQLIREKKPSLVISDIRMPHLDGIEMTARLMRVLTSAAPFVRDGLQITGLVPSGGCNAPGRSELRRRVSPAHSRW